MPEKLTNPQSRKLKGMAQRLDPQLKIGKQGLSEAFIKALDLELTRHELVKVKFTELKEQRKNLAPELARKTGAHLVTLLGNVAVFYRQNSNPEQRKVHLPGAEIGVSTDSMD